MCCCCYKLQTVKRKIDDFVVYSNGLTVTNCNRHWKSLRENSRSFVMKASVVLVLRFTSVINRLLRLQLHYCWCQIRLRYLLGSHSVPWGTSGVQRLLNLTLNLNGSCFLSTEKVITVNSKISNMPSTLAIKPVVFFNVQQGCCAGRFTVRLQWLSASPGPSYIFSQRLNLRQKSHCKSYRAWKDASFGTGHPKLKTSVTKVRYRSWISQRLISVQD
jgi:hypothetical protein